MPRIKGSKFKTNGSIVGRPIYPLSKRLEKLIKKGIIKVYKSLQEFKNRTK